MQTISLLIVVFALMSSGALSATFNFNNNCPYVVWPGTLTGAGSSLVSSSGFVLPQGASVALDIPSPWSGRFWARTGCTQDASGQLKCATADCASGKLECNGAGAIPPATLVEFTLDGYGHNDFYDVSLVDGYNLPLSITPVGAACNSTSCTADVNKICPSELSVKGSDGNTIACRSACDALKEPRYCCSGAFGTSNTCPPTDYSRIFKGACAQAYSYAYDDPTSTFTCPTGTANYNITFCP